MVHLTLNFLRFSNFYVASHMKENGGQEKEPGERAKGSWMKSNNIGRKRTEGGVRQGERGEGSWKKD